MFINIFIKCLLLFQYVEHNFAIGTSRGKDMVPEARTINDDITPSPRPWPDRFHALLFENRTGRLAMVNL